MGSVKGESASVAPKANCVLRSCPQLETGFSSIQRKRNQSWNLFFFEHSQNEGPGVYPFLPVWHLNQMNSIKVQEKHPWASSPLFGVPGVPMGKYKEVFEVCGSLQPLWASIPPHNWGSLRPGIFFFLTYKWKVYLFTLNYKGACEAKS